MKCILLLKLSLLANLASSRPQRQTLSEKYSLGLPTLFQIHLTRVNKPRKKIPIPKMLLSFCVALEGIIDIHSELRSRFPLYWFPLLHLLYDILFKLMFIGENLKYSAIEQTKLLSSIYFYLLCIYGPRLVFSLKVKESSETKHQKIYCNSIQGLVQKAKETVT